MKIHCSTCNFECGGHTIHTLIQQHLLPPLTSTVKSSLFMHVHSSPLFLPDSYIDAMQTILIILTTVGLFPDRPHVSIYLTSSVYFFSVF